MEYLSPLDAGFLDAEDEDRHASLAIASVAIVEGPPPSHDRFVALVRARLPLIPRYRHRVRTVPFDLTPPVWIDDPQFDLGFHVRRTALPAPGDEAALCRLVARVMSQRLDRDRPLWECWVIEGLAEGRWAVLVKVHHCMVDGVSGSQLLSLIFDKTRKPRATPEVSAEDAWRPEVGPSTTALMLRALGGLVARPAGQVHLMTHAIRSPCLVAHEIGSTARGLATLARALLPGARSSLTGPIGQQRRYGLVRCSLPEVQAVSQAFAVTVNDVVLASVTGALRALLLHRGEEPTHDAVRALVPVSVRAMGDEVILDNRISLMLPLLPVDIADPVERLRAVHTQLAELKASKEAEAGAAVTSLARHEPFAPISWTVRIVTRLPQRTIVTVATNVPGPRQPLYVAGRRILEILPYVPIAIRMRTGIAALSYCDQLTFGLTLDYDSAPEVDLIGGAIAHSLAELLDAARAEGARTVGSRRTGRTARVRTTARGGARKSAQSVK
jgi:diacylglycerol O-acyltransferase